MNEAWITIPRRLAMQLLQIAQLAGNDPRLGVVGARAEPECYYPRGDGESWQAPIDRVHGDGRSVWALLIHRPDGAITPAEVLIHAPLAVCLTTSLETRGVLQLRAWQCSGGSIVERDLRLLDLD